VVNVRWDNFLTTLPHPQGLTPFFTGNWAAYAENPDTGSHVFSSRLRNSYFNVLGGSTRKHKVYGYQTLLITI
jgi:hypothetical protein